MSRFDNGIFTEFWRMTGKFLTFKTEIPGGPAFDVFYIKIGPGVGGVNDLKNLLHKNEKKTTTWSDAQRDGRLAEYRWRPLLNAVKQIAKPRRETR